MQVEDVFAAALALFRPARPYAIAVSGGPDSTALMRLAAADRPLVLTVDHGLRPEAAAEAARVGGWARALGLEHRVLEWRGEKPRHGIQAAARAARYRLLAEACVAEGIGALMTGHTLDDQLETVAMRRARGSGASGEAGIASQADLPDAPVRLMRPLLAVRKAALVDWLGAAEFVTDPSNADLRFTRARLRADGTAEADLAALAAAQRARAGAERAALAVLAEAVVQDGRVLVSRAALTELEPGALDASLGALLRRVGGRDHPGTRAERARLGAAIRCNEGFSGRTLAGVQIRPARRAEGASGLLAFLPEGGGAVSRDRFWLPFGAFPQISADGLPL